MTGLGSSARDASWPPAILITGPTASGKTDLALALASRLPCELISVDSALVYRGMDIGTAKPAPNVLKRFPHRLVDICDPSEGYSTARFRVDALAAMAEISSAGRIPLLVGGTMLYWRALAAGLSALPAAQPQVRARLAERQAAEGSSAMHAWLAEVDPVTADRVHQNDPQRIQRALEVFLVTGRPMSGLLRRESGTALPYRVLKLVRSPRERSILHRRIEVRLQAMLDAGFEDEVRALHERADLNANLPSMRAVGYRQLWAYLSGEIGFEQMRERALAATRQLAKRQYTWLRAEQKALWLWDGPGVEQAALQQVEAFLDAGEPASHIDDRPCFR